MANHCIFCGEEIPEYKMLCGTCTAVMDALPPDRAKKLHKVIENEMAREELAKAIREFKEQFKIALAPVVSAICDFVDIVIAATEEGDDE